MKPTRGISSAPAAITDVGSRENIIANSIKPANTRFFKIKILAIHKNSVYLQLGQNSTSRSFSGKKREINLSDKKVRFWRSGFAPAASAAPSAPPAYSSPPLATKSTFCIRPGKPAARADTPKALENTPRLRLHGHKSAQIQAAKVKFFAAWICALKIGINIALQGMC